MFSRFYKNIGFVRTVADGIVTIVGLSSVRYGEMISFSNADVGVVLSLENRSVSAIVLGPDINILPGDFVFRTSKLMGVFVSGSLLGTIVNPLGKNLSNKKIGVVKNENSKYLNFKNLFKELLVYDNVNKVFDLSNSSVFK